MGGVPHQACLTENHKKNDDLSFLRVSMVLILGSSDAQEEDAKTNRQNPNLGATFELS